MNAKVVRWNVLVIGFREHRFVSATREPTAVNIARRNLQVLEHTNNKLQNLWMETDPIVRDREFTFEMQSADSKEDAERKKSQLMSDFKSVGLNVLNHR